MYIALALFFIGNSTGVIIFNLQRKVVNNLTLTRILKWFVLR